jgi:hypothetical protein
MNDRLALIENAQVAQWLRQAAEILQAQGANPFRVGAYRKAADTVEQFTGDWHFTALFSNTATAHQLGRTRDWVVIHFYDDDHAERQRTVVTEVRGALRGRRVVRGREPECRACYERGELAVAG